MISILRVHYKVNGLNTYFLAYSHSRVRIVTTENFASWIGYLEVPKNIKKSFPKFQAPFLWPRGDLYPHIRTMGVISISQMLRAGGGRIEKSYIFPYIWEGMTPVENMLSHGIRDFDTESPKISGDLWVKNLSPITLTISLL